MKISPFVFAGTYPACLHIFANALMALTRLCKQPSPESFVQANNNLPFQISQYHSLKNFLFSFTLIVTVFSSADYADIIVILRPIASVHYSKYRPTLSSHHQLHTVFHHD